MYDMYISLKRMLFLCTYVSQILYKISVVAVEFNSAALHGKYFVRCRISVRCADTRTQGSQTTQRRVTCAGAMRVVLALLELWQIIMCETIFCACAIPCFFLIVLNLLLKSWLTSTHMYGYSNFLRSTFVCSYVFTTRNMIKHLNISLVR